MERANWTRQEDERFWDLVAAGAATETIAAALKKTNAELRRRAYTLGLPLKWFKA